MTLKQILTYAAVAAAVVLAVYLGVALLHALIALAIVALVVIFVPPVRTAFGKWMGYILPPTATDIFHDALGDVESVIAKFEIAASGLLDEVEDHKDEAAYHTSLAEAKAKKASRATAAAGNFKSLIDA